MIEFVSGEQTSILKLLFSLTSPAIWLDIEICSCLPTL